MYVFLLILLIIAAFIGFPFLLIICINNLASFGGTSFSIPFSFEAWLSSLVLLCLVGGMRK